MIRWNNGKYEPEFRIILVFPQLLSAASGCTAHGLLRTPGGMDGCRRWCSLFVLIGMAIGAVASALYVVDAHRMSFLPLSSYKSSHVNITQGQIASEVFTCLLVFKNFFSFFLTYFAYDWLVEAGARKGFLITASIQVGVCLLSIPMCRHSLF